MARQATGQVIERNGKQGTTYAARVRAYGQRHYISLGYSWEGCVRRQAETELQNILADIRRGTWQPPQPQPTSTPAQPDDPTFHQFASQWFEGRRHEVSPRSVESDKWALTRHLLPFFKDHHLSQITIPEVDRYKNTKVREREQGNVERALSNRTINATLALLAQVLEMAVEYGHIPFNPARGKRRRLKAAQPKRTWLEPEQVKPLLDATVRGLRGGKTKPDPRTRALFATAICAGLRIGELLALRWGEVNLAQGTLTVLDSKTEAGVREIDIWPELHDVLAAYKAADRHAKPTAYVFATATGKADTRSNIAKRLKRAVERANEALAKQEDTPPVPDGLSPHSLRRTFASLLYLRGENPVYVMHQMGHTDPKLALRIYTKVMGEQRRRGPGARLVSVLDGARWTEAGADVHSDERVLVSPAPVGSNR